MRALVKHHAGEGLEFRTNHPEPEPGPREVRIRVTHAGICGTDRHIWEWTTGPRRGSPSASSPGTSSWA